MFILFIFNYKGCVVLIHFLVKIHSTFSFFPPQAKHLFNLGDYEAADKASQSAKNWSIASLVAGLVIGGLVVTTYGFAFALNYL